MMLAILLIGSAIVNLILPIANAAKTCGEIANKGKAIGKYLGSCFWARSGSATRYDSEP